MQEQIAIIGAGAAGCFCAIEIKRRSPAAAVTVYEAGAKALAKVAVTGGGRCNISNTFEKVSSLSEVYPRGEKLVRHAFRVFSPEDARSWWEAEGVRLVEEPVRSEGDTPGRLFPVSQDAMQVVRTLENLIRKLGIELKCHAKIEKISREADGFSLTLAGGDAILADKVVVTTGGGALNLLEGLGIDIIPPVPSLFTLKLSDSGIKELTGTTIENVTLSLAGTKFRSHGTLLLTDWGVSGPATLRLSSYAARHLADTAYKGTLLINWLSATEAEIRDWLSSAAATNPAKQVANVHPEGLTARAWEHILSRAGLREDIRWAELGSKGLNRLVAVLTADPYEITGRAKFKEEFVTAGGVSMSAVNPSTLESRRHPGLFFAGEVLDIDALTGGFNLQSAWSTAILVARHI
ncbi:MAG: aminoacetone oxidase family FAD-binding enzyme [Bacteroidales bacterium]|nr:aminoacetone oxidase family FAD-binding enzyme [Bacteroidales bacterium]